MGPWFQSAIMGKRVLKHEQIMLLPHIACLLVKPLTSFQKEIIIANELSRQGGQPGPRPYESGGTPLGPCFHCGEAHWVRDCPYPRKEKPEVPVFPPLTRYYIDCGIKHLVQDCPMNHNVKGKGSANFNLITMIPSTGSSSSSESDTVVPVNVLTRAQAKATTEIEQEKEEVTPSGSTEKGKCESWKVRCERREASCRTQKEKSAHEEPKENQSVEIQKENNPLEETKYKSSRGSVLADKHFEALEGMLKAYEARLKPPKTLEER